MATVVNRATGALHGAPKSLRRCSHGVRRTGSARLIRPSPAERRSASGGRRRRRSVPMSAQGLAFTHPFVVTTTVRSSSRRLHEGCRAAPTRTISTPSRRSAAAPARRARPTSRHSRCSGKGTPACTGIRPRTRSRAPITCRCPAQSAARRAQHCDGGHGDSPRGAASDSTAQTPTK